MGSFIHFGTFPTFADVQLSPSFCPCFLFRINNYSTVKEDVIKNGRWKGGGGRATED